jgi:predicted GH43/DUF377 family glycosyl hydrolase
LNFKFFSFIWIVVILSACKGPDNKQAEFAKEMTEFEPYKNNPVFGAGDSTAWDKKIRERGFILREDGIFKMWYTGYTNEGDTAVKYLGYATSKDGIKWDRYAGNPIFKDKWTEDMCVVKADNKYYMYAEGKKDVAHYLVSNDGIHWEEQGDLIILKTNGDTIPGPYGTPTAYVEDGKWYLFYERNDEAIWLATSTDHRTWKNVQDDPVIKPGPEKFDLGAVAADQVVKFKGKYYLFYHANADPGWMSQTGPWSSDVAISNDLVHWTKYPANPIVEGDHSSPVTVFDGTHFRLYTIHPDVHLYFSK